MSVGDHDDTAIRIVGRDLVGPREHNVPRPELQREHQPVQPAGADVELDVPGRL